MTKCNEFCEGLSNLVVTMISDGIRSEKQFKQWAEGHNDLIAQALAYHAQGKMPEARQLIDIDFHPELPLVLLNYTNVAQMALYHYPSGWTPALRACRGIVFDYSGTLIAKPFDKFFNHGEHPENEIVSLEGKEIEITVKMDGHLGIVFRYGDDFIVTTRGRFRSPTYPHAQSLVDEAARRGKWQETFPENVTVLAEIIHPRTRVIIDYGKREELIVIGAMNTVSLDDYRHAELMALGELLGLRVTEAKQYQSLQELLQEAKDLSITDMEGCVVRTFNPDGTSVCTKVKFNYFLGKWFSRGLSYTKILRWIQSGRLESICSTMSEETRTDVYIRAGKIVAITCAGMTKQEKKGALRNFLASFGEKSAYISSCCNSFVNAFYPACPG